MKQGNAIGEPEEILLPSRAVEHLLKTWEFGDVYLDAPIGATSPRQQNL